MGSIKPTNENLSIGRQEYLATGIQYIDLNINRSALRIFSIPILSGSSGPPILLIRKWLCA